MNPSRLIAAVVDASARRRGWVIGAWLVAALGALALLPRLRLDALPDLAQPQVIVTAEWMGKAPRTIEEQVTYPIVSRLQSLPGVLTVRGQSMTGMSFVYALFADGTDLSRARARVLEQLSALAPALPAGVVPGLGADASGVGWILQYALSPDNHADSRAHGRNVGFPTADALRAYQDNELRHALSAVPGVAEVATVGGHPPRIEIHPSIDRLQARGVTLAELVRAVRAASSDGDAGVLELGGRDVQVLVRASGSAITALESTLVRPGPPSVRVRDVADVVWGAWPQRGVADLDGAGDTVGGIVIMRDGENARRVLADVKAALQAATTTLPVKTTIVTTYDRSGLIDRAVATLGRTLLEETVAVILLVLIFLLHVRSAALPALSLPLAVLVTLGVLAATSVPATIMSLGGIAIALGATVDAEIVMLEACHRRLATTPLRDARAARDALAEAGRALTPAIVCSLLIIALGFLPVFALDGQAGRMFAPLAQAKTTVMLVSVLMSVTLAPALRDLVLRGRIRSAERNPLHRLLVAAYRPFVFVALRNPRWTLAMGMLAVLSALPVVTTLGEEFMPDLDEGDLLYMPTTLVNLGPEEAQRQLAAQDRALRAVPEVARVFGKAGRATTATDPAPLTMIETTIQLKPRSAWRRSPRPRWWSDWAPDPLRALLSRVWPEGEPWTRAQVVAALDAGVAMPGWTGAWTQPIRARIDMQATGVRTPVGLKIVGRDLGEIDRVGRALVPLLRTLPGTRTAVYEPILNGEAAQIAPDSNALSRYGVDLSDVQTAASVAAGGLTVGRLHAQPSRPAVVVTLPGPHPNSLTSATSLGEILIPAAGRPSALPGIPTPDLRARPIPPPDGSHADDEAMPAAPPARVTFPLTRGLIPLRDLATVRSAPAATMVRNENGRLTGYVYIDVDDKVRDLGGYVSDGATALDRWRQSRALSVPPGTSLQWTGNYEALAATRARLMVVVPTVLLVITLLLYALFRSVPQTLMVLLSIPFALTGSVWALALLDYRLSAAVWIGLIAVVGLAAQTGVVMIIYMDQAFDRRRAAGLMRNASDVVAAVLEGTVERVRPKLMTVAAMTGGLLPLLWASSAGSDVMKRIAAPMVGGLVSSAFLTLELIPVVYTFWRQRQLAHRSG